MTTSARPGLAGDPEVVLGLSFGFHDAAAALVIDGEIVAAAEQERFSRQKHDASIPTDATAACLDVAGISAGDVGNVVFYEKPLLAAARFLATKQRQGPRSAPSFFREAGDILGSHLLTGYRIQRMLTELGATTPPQAKFVEHHMSHAASAFFPSPFEHAGVLTVDGLGEWATATIGVGSNHRLNLLEEMRFPDSLGLVYSVVTSWCGFRPNSDEYKVMGLAPYGEPRFVDALSEIMTPMGDGSLRLDPSRLDWFRGRRGRGSSLGRLLDGPARAPEAPVTQREADLAASVQALTETAVLDMAARVHERTGEQRLCMAGGVALNCVANGRLLREGPFEEVWVQPAAGDAGGALGAALALWHLELGHPRAADDRRDSMGGAFLGPDVDTDQIEAALTRRSLPIEHLDEDALNEVVVDHLANGDVVAMYRGRMEFGPRALGNRSILADPRSATVRQRLNVLTKGREEFRPFAPAVIEERMAEWFDCSGNSPYMLVVGKVRAEHLTSVPEEPEGLEARAQVPRSTIPACTHVDGSARLQTVAEWNNPGLRALLERFEARTGCPVLVNTSFNRAGEPIVASADQAIQSAVAGGVDLLVLGDVVVPGDELRRAGTLNEDEVADPPAPSEPTTHTPTAGADRLGPAWAAATVPFGLQLLELREIGLSTVAVMGAMTLATLLLLRTRSMWAVAATLLTAGAFVANSEIDVRLVAVVGALTVMAGCATGYLPLPRIVDGQRSWTGRASLPLALPVLATDVLLITQFGLRVPLVFIAAGLVMVAFALFLPAPWTRLERLASPGTRAVAVAVRWLMRGVDRAFQFLARVIAVPLTALVFLIVVLLPWALQRLTFGNPLWAPHGSGSRWVERDLQGSVRANELWLPDPAPKRLVAQHRVLRASSAVAALAVVGVIALGAARLSVFDGLSSSEPPVPAGPEAADALTSEPWYLDWNLAYGELFARGSTSQYAGTELGDVESEHLNWKEGERRSWRGVDPSCTSYIDVWMLGGSALFGAGQRDDFTIPSEVAKLAWEDGYALDIANLGVPGDVAWVEHRRLERQLANGATPPDMLVFYDGFNDVRAPEWSYMAGWDIEGRFLSPNDRDLVPLISRFQQEERDGRTILYAEAIDINTNSIDTDAELAKVADAAAFQYSAAHDMNRHLAERLGIPMLRFFQPNVNSRDPEVTGDFDQYDGGRQLTDEMRDRLPDDVIDLADVLDGGSTPFYVDDVHTNEAANIPVAEQVWASMRPAIEQIAVAKEVAPCR